MLFQWSYGDMQSVSELVGRWGSHWSDPEVEATVWKVLAMQQLGGDFGRSDGSGISQTTPLAFLNPEAPPLLADPLGMS